MSGLHEGIMNSVMQMMQDGIPVSEESIIDQEEVETTDTADIDKKEEEYLFSSEEEKEEPPIEENVPKLTPVGEPEVIDEHEHGHHHYDDHPVINPGDEHLTEQQWMEKYTKNVAKDGLDIAFILKSQCPICGFKNKKAVEMIVRKGNVIQRIFDTTPINPVIGITTMCQNCGHIDMFGTKIENVLFYLRGKGDKCQLDESEEKTGGKSDT